MPEPIRIDFRKGSAELMPLIQRLGVKCVLDDLAAPGGDLAFEGWGPKGLSMIAIEIKKIHDFLGNMRNGHFVGKQLPRLVDHYDVRYLLVEGITRANPDSDILERPGKREKDGKMRWQEVVLGRSRFMAEDMEKYITSLEWAPIRIIRTSNEDATARLIVAKYHWYQERWTDHKSLRALFYEPYPTIPLDLSEKENFTRLVAAALPGIGSDKSLAATMRFKTILKMINASVEEWMTVPLVGKITATRVWRTIRGLDLNGESELHQ